MGLQKPMMFTKKPVDVEAMQFTDWSSAIDILTWGAPIFYVARGYEHHMRRENEHDRGNNHILDDAQNYLLLKTGDNWKRVDVRWWIIKDAEGVFSIISPANMTEMYEPKKPLQEFALGA